jgi:predicted deacylase
VSGLADSVRKRIGKDADDNVELVRRELRRRIAALQPENPTMAQRIALARRAYDADLVVDLHCDDEALSYMMAPDELWDEAKRFAADVGVHSLQSGGDSDGAHCFDDCFLAPWQALRKEFGERVPLACRAFTFEMGGVLDVDPKRASRYAQGFFRYLRRIGCIGGTAPKPGGDHRSDRARPRHGARDHQGQHERLYRLAPAVAPGGVRGFRGDARRP